MPDFFYGKPIMKRLDKISDHYIVNCIIDTAWEGIKISIPPQISRNKAICTVMNYYSKATSEIMAEWPEKPFKFVVFGLIPIKNRSIKIFRKNISMNDINKEMCYSYRTDKNKRIQKTINDVLKSNDLKVVANIAAKIMKITRKRKSSISILGITGADEKVYVGDNALKFIKEFYGNLFSKKPNGNIKKEKIMCSPIEFNEEIFEDAYKKFSLHKAMGWDQLPDEILKLPYIKNKFKITFKKILKFFEIPDYLKYGRLILLSKEKNNVYPKIENTRPIIVLSAVYKIIEIYWLLNTKELIWKNISSQQTGFREKGSTQYNICLLKHWLKKEKTASVIFVDIKKAYDHVIREKLYDILSYIGVSASFIKLYMELTSNMRVYLNDTEFVDYSSGVPQGSCISPILFNLYYEQALKKITPLTELLLGFADDLAIGMKTNKYIEKIQKEFNNWEIDFNLFVHNTKTQCILYNQKKSDHLIYPITDNYNYLGVKIYDTKSQFTKTSIIKNISEISKKCKSLFFVNCSMKINKLTIYWWYLSKILYNQISNLYLEFIPISEFIKIVTAKIKGILKINKNVSQKFVNNLFNLDLKKTVKKY